MKVLDTDGTLLAALLPGEMTSWNAHVATLRSLVTSNQRRGPAAGRWSKEALDVYREKLGPEGVELVTPFLARMKKPNGEWQDARWNVRVDSGSLPVRSAPSRTAGWKPWPANAREVIEIAKKLTEILQTTFPEVHEAHQEALQRDGVRQHRALKGTDFTTVAINGFRAATHRDTSDAEGTMGVMLVLGTEGTHCDLLFPEKGLAIETRPGDVVLFRGRDAMHANGPLQGPLVDPARGDVSERTRWKANRTSLAFYVKA